jgi:hypothetical protein
MRSKISCKGRREKTMASLAAKKSDKKGQNFWYSLKMCPETLEKKADLY